MEWILFLMLGFQDGKGQPNYAAVSKYENLSNQFTTGHIIGLVDSKLFAAYKFGLQIMPYDDLEFGAHMGIGFIDNTIEKTTGTMQFFPSLFVRYKYIGFEYQHISNADTHQPNDGLDFVSFFICFDL